MKAKIKRPATIGLVSCMPQRRTGMDTRRMQLAGPPAEKRGDPARQPDLSARVIVPQAVLWPQASLLWVRRRNESRHQFVGCSQKRLRKCIWR